MKKIFLAISFAFVAFASAPQARPAPQAEVPDTALQEDVLKNFVNWDKTLNTLSLDYTQETTFEGILISTSEGRIYKKDNKIRLDSVEDGKVTQSALTDKKSIKILDDKGKFITSLSWLEWQNSQANKALFDFGNYGAMLKTHQVKSFEVLDGQYKINLVPAGAQAGAYELEFILSGGDYFPAEIAIESEGVKTNTALKNIQKNIELKESLFK